MMDILLTDDNELQFENGDIVLGDGRAQRMRLRLTVSKGHLKHAPLVGEGVRRLVNSRAHLVKAAVTRAATAERIRIQFGRDGSIAIL